MTTQKLAEQLPALEALIVIGRTFAHLPGVDVQVGTIFSDTIKIGIHNDLGAFEAWREALGIPAESIDRSEFDGRLTLRASTTYLKAGVELIGYSKVPPEAAR